MSLTSLRKALTRSRSARAKRARNASRRTLRSRRLRCEPLEDRRLLSVVPNDPLFSDQWALDNTGQSGGTWDADIDAPAAWSVNTGNPSTVVAVLDTGIDYSHEDLYLNIWLNQGEIPAALASSLADTDSDGLITFRDLNETANASYVSDLNATGYIDAGDLLADPSWADGSDTDGNGYTDDLIGWDWVNNDNDPMDTNSHGTMVAGLLGAVGDNGVGVAGVSWRVQMMPLKFKFNNPTWTVDAAVSAIDYAVDQGAPISNNSWGNGTGEYIPEIYDAIDRARLAGHLFVAAAGNEARDTDSLPRYPASYDLDNIISVAATNHEDELASFSNWGATSVDLSAPSPNVMTTKPGNLYAPGSGTSSSTPHVAGVAALLHSLHPNWTAAQIKDRILSTVDPLPSLVGRTVAGGRLNAATSVADTTIHISDPSIVEGNSGSSALVFTATRRGDTTGTVTIDWSTADGTATAGTDYVAASGQVIFNPGETQQSFSVLVNGDTDQEGDETLQVGVQLASGTASIADPTAQGIILNDDTSITIADATVTEGDESISFVDAFVSAGSGGLSQPRGVVLGTDGDLYVSSTAEHNVLRYDGASGTFLDAFTAPRNGVLRDPQGLAFHNGSLFVGGWTSDNVVRFDDVTGALIGEFVSSGSGGLDNAVDLVFGPDGNLYVASWNTDEVLRYDGTTGAPMGAFVTAVSGGLDQPAYIAFGPDGNLYVGSNAADCVLRYDGTTGAYIDKFVATGSGGLDGPRELVFRPDGYLYVASAYSDEVLRYDAATGAFVDAVIPAASGGINYPIAVVFDSDGNLLVGSRDTDELLRYGPASQAAFTLSLSSPSALPVTVDFSTADGTASAVSDYEASTGTLTFAPGETSKTIVVPTRNDRVREADETFLVNLSNPTGGATIADPQGQATIIDVEAPLFADSFENGQWDGLWVEDSQNDWFTSTQRKTDGNDSAEVDGWANNATLTMANPIGLSPYGSAELSFSWFIEKNWDSGEYIALDVYSGGWHNNIASLNGNVSGEENVWNHETIDINSAYLTDDFKIRFRAKVSRSKEDGNVDNVQLFATSLATPPNQSPVAGDDAYSVTEDGVLTVVAPGVLTGDSDPDGDSLTASLVSGPGNGTLSLSADGSFTYTPNADFNGADSFTYRAFDGTDYSNTATVSITVNPVNDAPVANNQPVSTNEDAAVAITLTGTDVDGDPLTYSVVSGPANGNLSGAGPGRTYTPNADYYGSDSFTFKVNDGSVDSALATVSITVNAVNDPPTLSNIADQTIVEDGSTGALPFTIGDLETPAGSLTLSGNSSNTTLVPLGNIVFGGSGASRTVTVTPAADQFGTSTISVTVSDGSATALDTFVLTVTAVNDAPVADDQAVGAKQEAPRSITLTASDVEGDALTYSIVADPVNGTLSGTAPNVTYTPNTGYTGPDSFTFQASDARADSNVATVSITVAANHVPVADAQSVNTAEDTAKAFTLTGSDPDGDPLTFTVLTAPSQGTLSGAAPNATYTPSANYNGSDSFTFKVNDGTVDSDIATVSITVSAVNDAPVAQNDTFAVDEDASVGTVVGTVSATDPDVGDTLAYAITAGNTGTPFVINSATGQITVNGALDYATTPQYTLTVTVTDDASPALSDTATITINVNQVAAGPMLVNGIVSNVDNMAWTTVTLSHGYTSMVVVATPNYDSSQVPLVTRIQNASGNSFQLRVDRADGGTTDIGGIDVHYVVVEEGVYTAGMDGVTMEAVKFTSTVTDEDKSWVGESRTYANSYSTPVVVGQVMTYNDPDWSVFWSRGSDKKSPPSASTLYVGKNVAEDSDATRADETIGYIVIEAGSGTIGTNITYQAGLGADSVRGVGDSPSYNYSWTPDLPDTVT
ncbi:MAG: tandem-95 repeat protein, partial [Pirellulales bacterium]